MQLQQASADSAAYRGLQRRYSEHLGITAAQGFPQQRPSTTPHRNISGHPVRFSSE